MSPDIQSFDFDKDPIVLGSIQSTAKVQTEISAVISPEVAQQQAAFAELREEIQNGAVTFASTILKLAVPAAQAGENTTDDDLKIKDKYEQKLEDAEREVERRKEELRQATEAHEIATEKEAKSAEKLRKSTEEAKKSRKKAKDYLRGLYAKGYTRDRIMTEHREAGLSKRGTEFLISVLDEIAEEDRKK